MGGKKSNHKSSKKKQGRGGGGGSGGSSSAPRSPSTKPLPTIQQQLQSVSFLARVSAKPDTPRLCSCAPSAGLGSCAIFGAFCGLPVDVILLLLSHLPVHTLLRGVALLNTRWRCVAASAELWRPFVLARWPKLDALQQPTNRDGVRHWLVVYELWHSGAARDMLRLLKFCPLTTVAPDEEELLSWHRWWCTYRNLNRCPYGGVELFRRTPLGNLQLFQPNVVLDDAFERCRAELLQKFRCGCYTHQLYIAVSHAELRQLQLHGWGVVNPRLSCRPEGGSPEVTAEAPSFDRFLEDFRAQLEVQCAGKYDPPARELVANTQSPGVYAFWYNPGRAVLHREESASYLLAVQMLVPKSLPHGKIIAQQNQALTYSMSPLNRESVKPLWVAELRPPYKNRDLGWALLEMEWVDTVVPIDVKMYGRPTGSRPVMAAGPPGSRPTTAAAPAAVPSTTAAAAAVPATTAAEAAVLAAPG
uniref:F-box domain-containing protein n=1 Tax=Calcidiscus leptoporus TaxID=127549 RepID=A0A7S0JFJ6_9EUKA|mmetsp:Transcript_55584/g.127707  ORF Transcript_55584/g.127707 Transcript_55584/m.127707 type:complete len:473 (+) Transcript_55584:169-1587(+)